jgi:arylsulfatase A-like enzyme
VTDIAPTLLDLAGVQAPGTRYKDQDVEPMAGKSLLPVLTGRAQVVRGEREALGYELSGNAAIFKGDLKLVKNLPPVGDGKWHLYDMLKDPGETNDRVSQLPEVVRGMSADFDRYAQQNGVLAMPKDYNPQRQVLVNSFFNYWWPAYGVAAVVFLVLLLGYVGYWVALRIRRKRAS